MVFTEKISVVMPTYNTEVSILKEAVDSILNQTFGDFEFIIIDDGSTNNSVEYLKSLQDQRVKIIRNDTKIGITKSLNIGLRVAKGKYIARMDSDDIAFPDRFEKQYAFMESHPDVFVCGSKVIFFKDRALSDIKPADQTKKQYTFIKKKASRKKENTEIVNSKVEDMESYRVRMLFTNPGPVHPTAFFNHEKLIQYQIDYNEELVYAQDYDLWMRISLIGRICILPDILLYYRVHAGQISKAHREKQIECDQMTQRKLLEQLLDNVSEEELSFHYKHSSGYDSNAKISPRAIQWYGRIISANKERKIYDQKKLVQYIDCIKTRLISQIFTRDMSKSMKGRLLFQYLPFSTASKSLITQSSHKQLSLKHLLDKDFKSYLPLIMQQLTFSPAYDSLWIQ